VQHLRGNLYAIKGKSVRLADGRIVLTANSIFIDDHQKAIIDPASDHKVLQDIAKRNKIPLCFLSHSHIDHLCSYRLFRNSTLFLHQDEDCHSDLFENTTRSRRISKTRRLKEAIGLGRHASFERFKEGDTFRIGNTVMYVIHTPGHTKGHSCFYFPNEKMLYSADFDLSVLGPWYGQKDSNIGDFFKTAEKLRGTDADIWVTGHWKWIVVDNLIERIEAFMRKISEREGRIIDILQEARAVEEIQSLGLIYPRFIIDRNPWLRESEAIMITKNLERLEVLGRVRKVGANKWIAGGMSGSEDRGETMAPQSSL